MRSSRKSKRIGLTLSVALGTVVFSGPAVASTGPTAVDLGTLPGHGTSETIAVNDRGWVAGISYAEGFTTSRAVRWDATHRITDLGVLPGTIRSTANAISSRGTVVGFSYTVDSSGAHAVRWDRDGRGWCTLVKRGTFYPYAPLEGAHRDSVLELRAKWLLARELPVEPDLTRWFPIRDAPVP